MPAIGADARERVSTASRTANTAGGEYTIFTGVVAIAIVPVIIAQVGGLGSVWPFQIALGAIIGAATMVAMSSLAQRRLHRSGPALMVALASGDLTRLRATPTRKASPTS